MPGTRRGRPSRATIAARFEAATRDLARYGGLPTPGEAQPIWDDIWHLEAHASTAIEGNTLVLREVKILLDEGRAIGAKELTDYLEVQGYAAASTWVYRQGHGVSGWSSESDGNDGDDGDTDDEDGKDIVTIAEIREIHRETMGPVWEVAPHPDALSSEGPGDFRRHDIRSFGRGMKPPSWPLVPAELRTWVATANALGRDAAGGRIQIADLPERLAEVHAAFERVHPFLDGNGRVGRLVLNLVLVRLGYPPAIVFKKDRVRYLAALQRADQGEPAPLGELIARSVIDNLQRFVVAHVAGRARLVPLRSLVTVALSYAALRQAASRGRLEAELGADGLWRSTEHAVDAYRDDRYKRR